VTGKTATAIADRSADAGNPTPASAEQFCFHCGTSCRGADVFARHAKAFCCQGCLAVFELLTENGLADFYQLGDRAGVRVRTGASENQFRYLDQPGNFP
jgi:P-type Cu+ transporter